MKLFFSSLTGIACISIALIALGGGLDRITGPEPGGNAAAKKPGHGAAEEAEGARREPETASAVLAGGCFWCVEAVFAELNGVQAVSSGYAGGREETAVYEKVVSGRTRHAEAVKILYDPERISYERLLEVHFATHDPTQLNRQGPDIGPQYRSAIFYADETEKAIARNFIRQQEASGQFREPIVTTLEPLDAFYEAEAYHQNFAAENTDHPYIRRYVPPKIDTLRNKFPEWMKGSGPGSQE